MAPTKNSMTPAPTEKLSSDKQSSSVGSKADRSPRRMLSEDQKREVARLYAETTTPVPEIKRQFGIAESSLYRLIQQRGVAPRGRAPVAKSLRRCWVLRAAEDVSFCRVEDRLAGSAEVAAELQEGGRHLSNALVLRASDRRARDMAMAQRVQRLKSLQEPLRGGGGL